MAEILQAPFIWFGGKRKVAAEVWAALGPVDNYVEPFFGSGAVLLGRQDDRWETGAETINDLDGYVANFWRACAADPEAVAAHADWPVNENDLTARHIWLVNEGRERIARLDGDPDYYDAKVAGWWVWGINAWIGGGWCAGEGPWASVDGKLVNTGSAGRGVNRQLPHLGDAGQGVNRKRPHLGSAGQGVNRKLPHLGDAGKGMCDQRREELVLLMRGLADRLRRVRVCCGDWARVVTDGALSFGGTVGVFLDPPYSFDADRDMTLYRSESGDVAHAVRDWAVANGGNPRYRIVLCGYEDEHADLMPDGWRVQAWKAGASYQTSTSADGKNSANRHKERLWFSPHCLAPKQHEFAMA